MDALARIRELRGGKEQPKSEAKSETLIAFGEAVKSSDTDPYKLERGYLVLFSSSEDPDLAGEFFTAKTDFGDHSTSPIYYDHGLDKTLKKDVVGTVTIGMDAKGVWLDGQIDKAHAYAKDIAELAKDGKLGWSSGTASHLVEKKAIKGKDGKVVATEILKWPLGLDASLTPTPCEPRTRPDIMPVKSYRGPSFKALTEGESSQVDGSSAITDTTLPGYTYPVNPMVGHTMASKMATEHHGVVSRLYRNRTLSTPEYKSVMEGFGGMLSDFHTGLNQDVSNRAIDQDDDWEANWKTGAGMKTVGDALHAVLTRGFNAGADHMLTNGHVSSDEHKSMGEHFNACRDAYLAGLPEAVRTRDLSSNGTRYLSMKNSGDIVTGESTVQQEVSALLADADSIAGKSGRLLGRLENIKARRQGESRDLGPKAVQHIQDTLAGLDSLAAALKALIPGASAEEKVADAKAFLTSLQ